MGKIKTEQDYYDLADNRGMLFIGPMPIKTIKKTWWKCVCGRDWYASYDKISQGRRCQLCCNERRGENQIYGPKEYHELAKQRNLVWLGGDIVNSKTDTLWRCLECGKPFEKSYGGVKEASGCWDCAMKRTIFAANEERRKKPEDYHTLANSVDLYWIGPEVRTARIRTGWKCSYGHTWIATYGDIHNGNRCPECDNENRRLGPDKYHAVAKQKGFVWLGPQVKGTSEKTWWKCCENGHEIYRSYYGTLYYGCPHCPKEMTLGELKIKNFLDSLNIRHEPQKSFDTCRNKLPLRFDFFLPDFNILIEYNGELHHMPIGYFGGQDALDKTKKRDAIKVKWADDNDMDLLVIHYWDFDIIENKISELIRYDI